MAPAPIALFVFNRPDHTRRTLDSLKRNRGAESSDLFVFSDGPRNAVDEPFVRRVRSLFTGLVGFKSVTIQRREGNRGLAGSIIEGVSELLQRFGSAIVCEDDLLFSPHFLTYMNEALAHYALDQRIFSIGGYSPPIDVPAGYLGDSYLSYRCCTWGWATWRDRWARVDWEVRDYGRFLKDTALMNRFNRGGSDMSRLLEMQMTGKISSWGIRWDYAHFKNEAYCFRPVRSIVQSIGNDGSGIHCGKTGKYDVPINPQVNFAFPEPGRLALNAEINRRFAVFYEGGRIEKSPAALFKGKLRKMLMKVRDRFCTRAGTR